MPDRTWSFENSLGRVIETSDPTTAQQYRHDPRFKDVTVPVEPPPDPYAGLTKAELASKIEERNDARGDDEPPIEVAEPGNKPELLAALIADDATRADGA